MRHALIDEAGLIVNVVALADGGDWQAPKGFQAVRDERGEAEIGGRFDGAAFHPAPVIHPAPTEPTERELITALQAKAEALEARLAIIEAARPAESASASKN